MNQATMDQSFKHRATMEDIIMDQGPSSSGAGRRGLGRGPGPGMACMGSTHNCHHHEAPEYQKSSLGNSNEHSGNRLEKSLILQLGALRFLGKKPRKEVTWEVDVGPWCAD